MQKLKCETTTRGLSTETVAIDSGGLLHNVYWPKEGLVQDLINGVMRYVSKFLKDSDVHLIFDHYFDKSIKSEEEKKELVRLEDHINYIRAQVYLHKPYVFLKPSNPLMK